MQFRRGGRDALARDRSLAFASIAFVLIATVCMARAAAATAAAGAEAAATKCPSWVEPALPAPKGSAPPTASSSTTSVPVAETTTQAEPLPAVTAVGAPAVGATNAALTVAVTSNGIPVSVLAEYWRTGSPVACTAVRHPQQSRIDVALNGLQASATYHFRLVVKSRAGTALSKTGTFVTLRAGTIAEGVTVGGTMIGRLDRAAALLALNHSVNVSLRLTYAGAYWQVLPSRLGVHINGTQTVETALTATPGQQLPRLTVSVDPARLNAYLATLDRRWSHKPAQASVRLAGTRAVVKPARPGVTVKTKLLATQIKSELITGQRKLLGLAVDTVGSSAAIKEKAVVVRLSSQTLTAYLNGKPVLETPVTTGRPALPTPVGSYSVLNRESPFTFHSPWPPGSPYWYPPTPVTWAMEFYDGDFLHDDPGEPSNAFGQDSQDGYFASHGCVHLPHAAMAFLYNWLPIGAPVIIADD